MTKEVRPFISSSIDDCALAAAGGADKGHSLLLLRFEADVLHHILRRVGIAERYIPELHLIV